MMKSFFKKLAFVMALAMVVSMVAPAGAVFAAEVGISLQGGKTAVTEYALDVEESVDFAFVGYEGWKKGTPYTWESSDETVAVVDNGGIVTGLADGVATITVTVNGTWTQSVVVTVGTGKAADVNTPVANADFTVKQVSDKQVELVFADKTITKEAVSAGLSTYFVIYGTEVNYPVFYVDSVKDGVAVVKSYVLFEDGVTYGFTYGGKTAEFVASIGTVAYVTAKYKSENKDYAAYVGKDTEVVATLWNAKGIDITASAKAAGGSVQYALVTESANGDYWPSGTEGCFYFNTAGVSASVKVTYMTGEFDEMYNPIAGPSTQVTFVSSNIPEYDIDQTKAKTATIAIGAPDWTRANTVIALNDDRNSDGLEQIFVKMKDNRGNEITTETGSTTEGTFKFRSTDDSILYVAENGALMTNRQGDVSVLVYLVTTNEAGVSKEKVIAVVPVTVAAARKAVTIEASNMSAAVVSTESGYNETTFRFTLKDQLGKKIDANDYAGGFDVICNNANNLPNGATVPPDIDKVRVEKGVYDVTITGKPGNLPTSANGYTYTFTVKVDSWLTRTFNVTVRKPVYVAGSTTQISFSGYKLEFENTTDIKTLATTVAAFDNIATLYQLSNNVKYSTATLKAKPASIDDMKVGEFYYSISKDGSALSIDEDDSYVRTVGGKIKLSLTQFATITGTENANLDGNFVVQKDKKGAGNYTVLVYRGEGPVGATNGATASTFRQVTSTTLTVKDTQDTVGYLGRNGQNEYDVAGEVNSATVAAIVKAKFMFQIGDTTLDHENDFIDQNIEVVPNYNFVAGGSVVYINSVDLYKFVGVTDESVPVYVKYTVNVGDYVTLK